MKWIELRPSQKMIVIKYDYDSMLADPWVTAQDYADRRYEAYSNYQDVEGDSFANFVEWWDGLEEEDQKEILESSKDEPKEGTTTGS